MCHSCKASDHYGQRCAAGSTNTRKSRVVEHDLLGCAVVGGNVWHIRRFASKVCLCNAKGERNVDGVKVVDGAGNTTTVIFI